MDNLLKELEALRISGDFSEQNSWMPCIDLIQRNFVPQKTVGMDRPCEEKDFREYRLVVEKNLHNVRAMLQHILSNCKNKHLQITGDGTAIIKMFGMNLLLLIGEHKEKNIWNTTECITISKELLAGFCELFACSSVSQFLSEDENLSKLLIILRPKLHKDVWKTYPAAVACYKWILQEAEKPVLFDHIGDVIPTALVIIDDYVSDNVVIGLECIYLIIQHSHMRKGLIDTGYAKVIYHALERLTHQKEIKYIIPLYSCMATLLVTIEHWDNTIFQNIYEWTLRDDVLSILVDNMAFEQNIELRHAYMSSLPQFLTNLGCAKWCEALSRILVEYCEHHTDLKTLKATLEAAKVFLLKFHLRVAPHCVRLYTAFLKVHCDLTETPVFDREIMQHLEDCIGLLYDLSRDIGRVVMNDERMHSVMNSNLPIVYQGDIKYFQ